MSADDPVAADGSSKLDARQIVKISRRPPERWRYVCPNGHPQWDRTNNHIWCPQCAKQAEQDDEIDPEHWHIHDKRTNETIHWSHVRVVEE